MRTWCINNFSLVRVAVCCKVTRRSRTRLRRTTQPEASAAARRRSAPPPDSGYCGYRQHDTVDKTASSRAWGSNWLARQSSGCTAKPAAICPWTTGICKAPSFAARRFGPVPPMIKRHAKPTVGRSFFAHRICYPAPGLANTAARAWNEKTTATGGRRRDQHR